MVIGNDRRSIFAASPIWGVAGKDAEQHDFQRRFVT
jgi:hypothetical protein